MAEDKERTTVHRNLLTQEQEELLDLYLQKLDKFYDEQKNSVKVQVEIETAHLKKVLGK
ncbi:hypothetical protein ACFSRY_01745 [Pontibacter locisalis]|uniref:Uncharacterized protein n=1 Tax=Pontibacter locisalis TaxID=1719035 RepID=A0ABW5IFY3_9BACT